MHLILRTFTNAREHAMRHVFVFAKLEKRSRFVAALAPNCSRIDISPHIKNEAIGATWASSAGIADGDRQTDRIPDGLLSLRNERELEVEGNGGDVSHEGSRKINYVRGSITGGSADYIIGDKPGRRSVGASGSTRRFLLLR